MKNILLIIALLVTPSSFAAKSPCGIWLEGKRVFDLPLEFLSKIDLKEQVLDGKQYHALDMTRIATGQPERADYEMLSDNAGNFQGLSFTREGSEERLSLHYRDAIPEEQSPGEF